MKTEARTVNAILGKSEHTKHTVDDILEAHRRTIADNLADTLADVAEYGRKHGKTAITQEQAEVNQQMQKSTVSMVNETAKSLSKRLGLEAKELAKILQWHVQRIPYQEREDMIQNLALYLLDTKPSNPKLAFAICQNFVRDWWKYYHVRQHMSIEAIQERGNGEQIEHLAWLREDYAQAVHTLEANHIPLDQNEVTSVMVELNTQMAELAISDKRKRERAEVVNMAHTIADIAHYECIEHIDNASFARSVWERLPKQIQDITLRKINRIRLTRWEISTLQDYAAKHSHLLLIEN